MTDADDEIPVTADERLLRALHHALDRVKDEGPCNALNATEMIYRVDLFRRIDDDPRLASIAALLDSETRPLPPTAKREAIRAAIALVSGEPAPAPPFTILGVG